MRRPAVAAVVLVVVAAAIACGGSHPAPPAIPATPQPLDEQLLGLLPPGMQIVVELDLERLRANPVVGPMMTRILDERPLPASVTGTATPLGRARRVVLAAYGVGTTGAATVTLVATTEAAPESVDGGRKLGDAVYALGPPEWLDQLAQRTALANAAGTRLAAPDDLMKLRARAMPPGAPGASVRLTARLAFDARVSLARQTGLELAPAAISLWGDVVDDLAIVVEADASDPGEAGASGGKKPKQAAARLARAFRAALAQLADLPFARALGLPSSFADANVTPHAEWVRMVIAIGPSHLQRVVQRATALLEVVPAATPDSEPPP